MTLFLWNTEKQRRVDSKNSKRRKISRKNLYRDKTLESHELILKTEIYNLKSALPTGQIRHLVYKANFKQKFIANWTLVVYMTAKPKEEYKMIFPGSSESMSFRGM